jgi:hypothetical protein
MANGLQIARRGLQKARKPSQTRQRAAIARHPDQENRLRMEEKTVHHKMGKRKGHIADYS